MPTLQMIGILCTANHAFFCTIRDLRHKWKTWLSCTAVQSLTMHIRGRCAITLAEGTHAATNATGNCTASAKALGALFLPCHVLGFTSAMLTQAEPVSRGSPGSHQQLPGLPPSHPEGSHQGQREAPEGPQQGLRPHRSRQLPRTVLNHTLPDGPTHISHGDR